MELILSKIKLLAEQNKYSVKKVCMELGLTETGFYKMFKADSLKVSTLEKISNFFNVPISYFFDDSIRIIQNGKVNVNGVNNSGTVQLSEANHAIELLKKDVESLKLQLTGKDKEISTLEKLIQEKEKYIEVLEKQLEK